MKRFPLILPALIAWVALCLPWQICSSDCRTAVVGGWQHDCHLADASCSHGHGHGGGGGGGGTTQTQPGGNGRGFCNPGDGEHDKLTIPLVEPVAVPAFEDLGDEVTWGAVSWVELCGLPRSVLCRGTGPPGARAESPAKLRSAVLLL